ncbi:hypothetical protein, partial [Paenibacillus graminis]|uniref:hypothetical protein n=1 Tax=Paenibacillus graminis TaxID=189425 RepID=UPI001EE1BA4F
NRPDRYLCQAGWSGICRYQIIREAAVTFKERIGTCLFAPFCARVHPDMEMQYFYQLYGLNVTALK